MLAGSEGIYSCKLKLLLQVFRAGCRRRIKVKAPSSPHVQTPSASRGKKTPSPKFGQCVLSFINETEPSYDEKSVTVRPSTSNESKDVLSPNLRPNYHKFPSLQSTRDIDNQASLPQPSSNVPGFKPNNYPFEDRSTRPLKSSSSGSLLPTTTHHVVGATSQPTSDMVQAQVPILNSAKAADHASPQQPATAFETSAPSTTSGICPPKPTIDFDQVFAPTARKTNSSLYPPGYKPSYSITFKMGESLYPPGMDPREPSQPSPMENKAYYNTEDLFTSDSSQITPKSVPVSDSARQSSTKVVYSLQSAPINSVVPHSEPELKIDNQSKAQKVITAPPQSVACNPDVKASVPSTENRQANVSVANETSSVDLLHNTRCSRPTADNSEVANVEDFSTRLHESQYPPQSIKAENCTSSHIFKTENGTTFFQASNTSRKGKLPRDNEQFLPSHDQRQDPTNVLCGVATATNTVIPHDGHGLLDECVKDKALDKAYLKELHSSTFEGSTSSNELLNSETLPKDESLTACNEAPQRRISPEREGSSPSTKMSPFETSANCQSAKPSNDVVNMETLSKSEALTQSNEVLPSKHSPSPECPKSFKQVRLLENSPKPQNSTPTDKVRLLETSSLPEDSAPSHKVRLIDASPKPETPSSETAQSNTSAKAYGSSRSCDRLPGVYNQDQAVPTSAPDVDEEALIGISIGNG